jgi:hypothetical protein
MLGFCWYCIFLARELSGRRRFWQVPFGLLAIPFALFWGLEVEHWAVIDIAGAAVTAAGWLALVRKPVQQSGMGTVTPGSGSQLETGIDDYHQGATLNSPHAVKEAVVHRPLRAEPVGKKPSGGRLRAPARPVESKLQVLAHLIGLASTVRHSSVMPGSAPHAALYFPELDGAVRSWRAAYGIVKDRSRAKRSLPLQPDDTPWKLPARSADLESGSLAELRQLGESLMDTWVPFPPRENDELARTLAEAATYARSALILFGQWQSGQPARHPLVAPVSRRDKST